MIWIFVGHRKTHFHVTAPTRLPITSTYKAVQLFFLTRSSRNSSQFLKRSACLIDHELARRFLNELYIERDIAKIRFANSR